MSTMSVQIHLTETLFIIPIMIIMRSCFEIFARGTCRTCHHGPLGSPAFGTSQVIQALMNKLYKPLEYENKL